MPVDLSMISLNQIIWIVLILLVIVGGYVVVRYFLTHVFHFLFHGCGLILLIAAIVYALHLLKVF